MVRDLQFKYISSKFVKVICMKCYYKGKIYILGCNIQETKF